MNHKNTIIFFAALSLITLMMGCSGSKYGTALEGKDMTVERDRNDRSPLYVVNGTILTSKEPRHTYLLLKPKYFEKVQVQKGEEAKLKYGKLGEYRAIETTLSDSVKAYNDLLDKYSTDFSERNTDSLPDAIKSETKPATLDSFTEIMGRLNYPEACKQRKVEGRVTVQFWVDISGRAQNPNIVEGIGWGCDYEAMRVAKTIHFMPGITYGKTVSVRMSIPFGFRLQ